MTDDDFQRLLMAPEIVIVDLTDATLAALERALRVEHPLVDSGPPTEHPRVRRRARAILRSAQRLRAALHDYQDAVDDALRKDADAENDLPF
jgi:hypothetical protein